MEIYRFLLVLLSSLTVLRPPMCTIFAQASQLTVTTEGEKTAVEGANVQLSCTYAPETSSAEFGYLTWSKDGSTLLTYECTDTCELVTPDYHPAGRYALTVDMISSGTLTISGVRLADEGKYTCSVFTSDLILASGSTHLSVHVPPQGIVISDYFTTSYVNNSIVHIQVDQSYRLQCATSSPTKPGVIIVWESDGIDITLDEQVVEPSSGDSRLLVSSRVVHVTPAMGDAGRVLRCLVTHPLTGTELMSSVALDVQDCPSSVIVHQCPSAVISGDSETLGCRSAATSPPPSLYWLYEGVRVENSSTGFRSEIAEDGTHLLMYAKQFDKVDYNKDFVCCIERTSMCNQLCSTPCRPDIRYSPSNLEVHTNMPLDSIVEGVRNFEINCTADGNPMGPSHITWTRITESGTEGAPRSSLKFDEVHRSDAGVYRCTVDNGVGASRLIHTKIIVRHPPNITNQQDYRIHANQGDTTTLTCNAEGYPKPAFRWHTPDNRTIDVSSSREEVTSSIVKQTDYSTRVSSLLYIGNIDPLNDYGNYRCEAYNDYGASQFVINLSGKSKPFRPHDVQINNKLTSSSSLSVTWLAGHDGGAPQTFTVTSCLEGTNKKCTVYRGIRDQQFEILGLRPYSWYDISVTGVNEFGESDASTVSRHSTSPLTPNQLGVVASYDSAAGVVVVRAISNQTQALPEDVCFYVEVKVIMEQRARAETCLRLDDKLHVGRDVLDSQLFIVSCGRDVCSGADHVESANPGMLITSQQKDDLSITNLTAIVAGAVVCLLIVIILVAAWHYNRKRGYSWNKTMNSRKLPTLPRTATIPPSPTCQEAIEGRDYDGLELYSVNPYMHPYAQSTTLQSKEAIPSVFRAESQNNNQTESHRPPPSGDDLQRNHQQGIYTTTLSYVPMSSPSSDVIVQKSSANEPEFLSNGKSRADDRDPEKADVDTGLLVDIGNERSEPIEDYYSVPKRSPVAKLVDISETTPALSSVD